MAGVRQGLRQRHRCARLVMGAGWCCSQKSSCEAGGAGERRPRVRGGRIGGRRRRASVWEAGRVT
jgi:hypothetical protein